MSKYEFLDRRVPIEDGNIALVQDLSKCKNCSLCRKACAVDMGVFDYYDLTTNGDHPICIHCGQCASICPFDSINERSEIDEVKAAMDELRAPVDKLEMLVDKSMWPMPSYGDLLFEV